MNIDVIIPTFNEEKNIANQILALTQEPAVGSIIIVDGGSQDQTKDIVSGLPGVQFFETNASRGYQQNYGAKKATADVLLFLHADVILPKRWSEIVEETLCEEGVVAGAFQIQTIADPEFKSWADPFLFLADYRSRYTNKPYGDQCIFVKKSACEEIGGYPVQPIFEDYEFSKRLSQVGNIRVRKEKTRVSGRRMQQRPIYYFIMMNVFPWLYRWGVGPEKLVKKYKKF